jgi:uncharacterized protein YjiS (DUF1127 family)
MQMDIPFTESRPLRARGGRPVLRPHSVLSTLIRQMSDWIGLWLANRRSSAELATMDDRLLRDIGLRREEVPGIWRHARPPSA